MLSLAIFFLNLCEDTAMLYNILALDYYKVSLHTSTTWAPSSKQARLSLLNCQKKDVNPLPFIVSSLIFLAPHFFPLMPSLSSVKSWPAIITFYADIYAEQKFCSINVVQVCLGLYGLRGIDHGHLV